MAESLGGVESLAELPSVMTHASVSAEHRNALGITDNLIRLSVGCEDSAFAIISTEIVGKTFLEVDLIADIDQALDAAINAKNRHKNLKN